MAADRQRRHAQPRHRRRGARQSHLRHARLDKGSRAGDDEADYPGTATSAARATEVRRRFAMRFAIALLAFCTFTAPAFSDLGTRKFDIANLITPIPSFTDAPQLGIEKPQQRPAT